MGATTIETGSMLLYDAFAIPSFEFPMYNFKDISDTELAKQLPHTMGTQHPDNVSAVPFGDSPMVSRALEEEEVLYNISVLALKEIMIDYERKQGGCTPLWDWLHKCSTCLEINVIGRDFHITPRIPNGDRERDDPYFWQSLGIFVSSLPVMSQMGHTYPAFSEFIVPDTTDGVTVAKMERDIYERYELQRNQYRRYSGGSPFPFEGDFFVQGIPLIETIEDLLHPERIWDELIARRREWSKKETYVQRSFIARSDPALKAGMIPALLAAVVALDRGRQYENRTGVRIPQIVGIGSAPFRGGLIPDPGAVEAVVATYPGMATVTVQSAFRYDYPLDQVISANSMLEKKIGQGWLERDRIIPHLDSEELEELRLIVKTFKDAYEISYREILPLVSKVFPKVPSHRERYTNVEVAGDDRRVGGLPAVRAIKFAAACYALGLPPGVMGLRAWRTLHKDQEALIDKTCPTVRFWMGQELQWSNPDNVKSLARSAGLRSVAEDLDVAMDLAKGSEIHSKHAEVVDQILAGLNSGEDFAPLVLEAAAQRGFLG